MAECKTRCSKCGAALGFRRELIGQTRVCPKCGNHVLLEVHDDEVVPSAVRPLTPTPEPAASGDAESFPERMKANRAIAGRVCAYCSRDIELGDAVFNCPDCGTTMHEACYNMLGACIDPSCGSTAGEGGFALADHVAPPKPWAAPTGNTKECRFCGEAIQISARKCRYCGEFQDQVERDRRAARSGRAGGGASDDNLCAWEIIFGLLCGGIACIVGIVFICMGKKKGWKLMGLGILSIIGWQILQAIILAAQ